MPLATDRTVVEVKKTSRWKLKRLAARLERPMYKVLEELIDAAAQEPTKEAQETSHDARHDAVTRPRNPSYEISEHPLLQ